MTASKENPMLNIHIARTGNDNNPGTAEEPLATLAGARDRLRAMRRSRRLPDGAVVTLHAGAYRLSETFRLTAEDSGTADAPFVAGRTVHLACWTRQGPTRSRESLTVRGPAETIGALK